jgi:hypothetical protein
VVANYVLHRYYGNATEEPQVAAGPSPEAAASQVEAAAAQTQVRLAQPLDRQVTRGQLPLVAEVTPSAQFAYLLFQVDGAVKALSNSAPHVYSLDTRRYKDGEHRIAVQACDAVGRVLCQAEGTFIVDNRLQAGE